MLDVEGLLGDAVEAVAVDVQALQAGSLQRGANLGFGKVALPVDGGLAPGSTVAPLAAARHFEARFADRAGGDVEQAPGPAT